MKKKILFMIGTLLGGGAEKVLCDIVKNLDKEKFDITVQTVMDEGVYIDEVKKHATYKTIYKTTASTVEEAEQLNSHYRQLQTLSEEEFSKAIIDEEYDIEVAFLESEVTRFIANSPNKSSRKIAWVHTDLIKHPEGAWFYPTIEGQKGCYEKFDGIVCVSTDAKEAFIQRYQINANLHVLYNPIDVEAILSNANKPPRGEVNHNKFNIIAIGRLVPQKGFDRLLLAHRQLISEGFDYNLLIVGEGEQRGVLEKYVEDHSLASNTEFLGFQQNPYSFLKGSNLMICSSRVEGFSLVVAEALVLGIPVLATRCSGPVELLDNGRYGMVVENDLQNLYEGMRYILTHTVEYHKYKKASEIRGKMFDLRSSIRSIEKVLLGVES